MKKCYIVGAGEMYGSISPCEDDLVIAADGGLEHLLKLGLIPDVIVGDFDSVSEKVFQKYGNLSEDITRVKQSAEKQSFVTLLGKNVEVFSYPVMKDETDMQLAYQIGASRGYTSFELYGGVGGREDHTFANYCLLLRAKNDKNNAVLLGNKSKTFIIQNEKISVFGREGATASVFSFGGTAHGVSVLGLKYEARNITINPHCSLGVSNSFLASGKGEISVDDGALLITVFD